MPTPEIAREANKVKLERRKLSEFTQNIRQESLRVLRNHGDEVIAGKEDEYLIRNLPLSTNGTDFEVDLVSGTGKNGLTVFVGFKSVAFNRLLFIHSSNTAIVVNCTYEQLASVSKRRKKREEEVGFFSPRRATLTDLRQFKELVGTIAEAVSERRGQPDRTFTHHPITLSGF